MSYLLDANVFIQAKNLHYGFDFCPAFWEWLIAKNGAGQVHSIEKVGDELQAGSDDLATWAKERGERFFLKPDPRLVEAFGPLSAWATTQSFDDAAVYTFLRVADYYLIAHALAHGSVVVTHEVPSDSKKKIKIPNACIGVGIKCVTPYEMLRSERARFVLGVQP